MSRQHDWSIWHARLQQRLKQQFLFPRNSRILIAVSGGQDSVCLAKLILDLRSLWDWQIAIAHCDHDWSTDQGIAKHVEQIALNWQIPFYLEKAINLKETEAAARKWRYQALQKIAEQAGFNYVATGHTKSDRAETFLYNLIRGAGADGLSSLDWHRDLTPEIQLVRPILDFTRAETAAFCQQFDLSLWLDAANDNLQYARNRIRKQLIPYLQTNFNPQVENCLVQTMELLQADKEYLEEQATELLSQVLSSDGKRLNRLKLRAIPVALQRRIIRQFFPLVFSFQPNFKHIEAIRSLIEAPNKTTTSTIKDGIVAVVCEDWIIFSK